STWPGAFWPRWSRPASWPWPAPPRRWAPAPGCARPACWACPPPWCWPRAWWPAGPSGASPWATWPWDSRPGPWPRRPGWADPSSSSGWRRRRGWPWSSWAGAGAGLARRLGATLVAGVTEPAGDTHFHNAVVAWGPDGTLLARYEKVRRVPFGEYVPLRSLVRRVVHLELVPRDALPGHGPNV